MFCHRVKGPQKVWLFLKKTRKKERKRQNSARPEFQIIRQNMLSMHVKSEARWEPYIKESAAALWCFGVEASPAGLTGALSTARPHRVYNVLCVYVCVYGCAHACFLCGGSSAVPCAPSRRLCVCVCLCGCVPAPALCVPMCAVRRKWLCLFKLSTLSHVGQFSGNENPAPCPLPSPPLPLRSPGRAQFSSPHFTPL